MVSFAPGAAAAAAGHQNNPPPAPSGKYFTHTVGTGVSRARFNEVVVQIDFEDDKAIIGTPSTVNATPHIARLLMLVQKALQKQGEILPMSPTSASPVISRTTDVPTGSDLIVYTGKAPEAIMMPGARPGIRLRLRLRLPCTVGALKGNREFFNSLNLKGKRAFMNPVTCKATDLIRIGWMKGWNPDLKNRDAAMTELGLRGLGFQVPSEAMGKLIPGEVLIRDHGVKGHAVCVYADRSIAAKWQEQLVDLTMEDAVDATKYPETATMEFVPFNMHGAGEEEVAASVEFGNESFACHWISGGVITELRGGGVHP